MAPSRRGRSTSGSRTRYKYLDAIEVKSKKLEESNRRFQEELQEERRKSSRLVAEVGELSARVTELIAKLGEVTASSENKENKRKRPKAPTPTSDSDEDDADAVRRPATTKRPATAEKEKKKVSTPPPATNDLSSVSEMEEDVPSEEEATPPKKKTMADAVKTLPATRPQTLVAQAPAAAPAAAPPSAAVKAAEKRQEKIMSTIPPVVIEGNDDWTEVRRKMKAKNIGFKSAQLTARSMRIVPATVDDFRRLTKQLDEDKRGYHSFTLGQDKCLHAVIRKLGMKTDPKDIELELQEIYGITAEVNQMMDRRKKRPMPLFLVKTKNPRIFDVRILFDLVVKVEEKKKSREPTQCYRCQAIGHSQQHCHHEVRCVACGGNHRSTECTREKPQNGERNAHCCNCDSDGHPANYRGCPKFPKRSYAAAARQGKPGAARRNNSEPKKSGPSQQPATQAKKPSPAQPPKKIQTDLTATLQTLDKDQLIQTLLALLGNKQC